jgi:hypothetical protein
MHSGDASQTMRLPSILTHTVSWRCASPSPTRPGSIVRTARSWRDRFGLAANRCALPSPSQMAAMCRHALLEAEFEEGREKKNVAP